MSNHVPMRRLCELCQNQHEASPCAHHDGHCSSFDTKASVSKDSLKSDIKSSSGRRFSTPQTTSRLGKSYTLCTTKSSPGKNFSTSDTKSSPGKSYSPSNIKSSASKGYSQTETESSLGKNEPPSKSKSSPHKSRSSSNAVTKPTHGESEEKEKVKKKKGSLEGHTVLITGGAGFLGGHIVSLLQTRADHVTKIKVLDLKPYINQPGTEERTKVDSYTGCITDLALLRQMFAGVDSVYHVAGKISYGTQLDMEGMHKINVQGTQNVIQACLETGVKHLIFCSTVDVVIGHEDIVNGDETTTAPPKQFLFPGYPEMKYKAESLVLEANGATGCNGTPLKTISLRANVMYGPGDPYYITSGLKNAHSQGGILYQVGNGTAKFQPVYVGNTAWAFLCADQALERAPETGGQFYFIPDHTPLQNTFHFMRPFLKVRGYQLSSIKIPYRLVYGCLLLAEMVVKVLSPLITFNLPTESYSVKYINMNLYFSGRKARDKLGFMPIFSPDVAICRSIEYYKHVKL